MKQRGRLGASPVAPVASIKIPCFSLTPSSSNLFRVFSQISMGVAEEGRLK